MPGSWKVFVIVFAWFVLEVFLPLRSWFLNLYRCFGSYTYRRGHLVYAASGRLVLGLSNCTHRHGRLALGSVLNRRHRLVLKSLLAVAVIHLGLEEVSWLLQQSHRELQLSVLLGHHDRYSSKN